MKVYKKINLSVISTGDELVDTSTDQINEGHIFDSNRPMLLSLFDKKYIKLLLLHLF